MQEQSLGEVKQLSYSICWGDGVMELKHSLCQCVSLETTCGIIEPYCSSLFITGNSSYWNEHVSDNRTKQWAGNLSLPLPSTPTSCLIGSFVKDLLCFLSYLCREVYSLLKMAPGNTQSWSTTWYTGIFDSCENVRHNQQPSVCPTTRTWTIVHSYLCVPLLALLPAVPEVILEFEDKQGF